MPAAVGPARDGDSPRSWSSELLCSRRLSRPKRGPTRVRRPILAAPLHRRARRSSSSCGWLQLTSLDFSPTHLLSAEGKFILGKLKYRIGRYIRGTGVVLSHREVVDRLCIASRRNACYPSPSYLFLSQMSRRKLSAACHVLEDSGPPLAQGYLPYPPRETALPCWPKKDWRIATLVPWLMKAGHACFHQVKNMKSYGLPVHTGVAALACAPRSCAHVPHVFAKAVCNLAQLRINLPDLAHLTCWHLLEVPRLLSAFVPSLWLLAIDSSCSPL